MKTTRVFESSLEQVKYGQGKHPNSQKNLKPFPKGSNGRVRGGYSLTAALQAALGDKKKRDALIASTLKGAIAREPTPFKEVWERLEGKVVEQHAMVGALLIEVEYVDRSKQIAGT